jgi:hypothetical protein
VGGEDWSNTPLGGGAVVMALAAVCAGVILIARSQAVGSLISRHATELGEVMVEAEEKAGVEMREVTRSAEPHGR